jgi:hypothetical protein
MYAAKMITESSFMSKPPMADNFPALPNGMLVL